MKETNETNEQKETQKNGNVLGHYLCTSFSLVIQQQQKHVFITYDGKLISSPNLNALPRLLEP
jgi:hypothetical protein